jgi:sugar phosphate isomerase/epimerase
MVAARIGHTALTWDGPARPDQRAVALTECADLGYQGIETGGRLYDRWRRERPGELRRRLDAAGPTLVCLGQGGEWTDSAAKAALLRDGEQWTAAVAEAGGETLMLVPEPRRSHHVPAHSSMVLAGSSAQ